MPKTLLGKWSVLFIILFLLLFVVFQILVLSGQRGGDTFFSNMTLTIPALSMAISGIASFSTGVISIVKDREKSLLVFIATVIGLLVLLFCTGEILFPH